MKNWVTFHQFFHLSFPKVFYESTLLCIITVPYKSVLLSIIPCRHLPLTYHTQKYFIKVFYYLVTSWTLDPDPDPRPWTLNPDAEPGPWTRTLDPDPEKLDPEKPRAWKTWSVKNLDLEKSLPWKTWTLKNMGNGWIWKND